MPEVSARPSPTPAASPVPPLVAETPPAVSTESALPGPEEFRPSKEASRFAERLQAAVFALENLPGYTYSVTDPSVAPNLVLTGRVVSPKRREWTVSEQGAANHILARWVLVDGKSYTDRTGRWEVIEQLPFDPANPISFARGFLNQLFESYLPGESAKEEERKTEVGGRAATSYRLVRKLASAEQIDIPEGMVPKESTDTAWIASDGGYLLRYTGTSPMGIEEKAERVIEVTPLRAAPDIRAPEVGSAAFKGAPPPWRASVIGLDRLRDLKSYRYSYVQGPKDFGHKGEGRISATQGSLKGSVVDPNSMPMDPNALPTDLETNEVELIYIGGKAWARVAGGSWRRIATNVMTGMGAGTLPEQSALQLATSVPTGPPLALLGNDPAFTELLDFTAFGIVDLDGRPILTQGKLMGMERVNGVQALHYTGKAGIAGGGSRLGRLDLWLAKDGLYIVRSRADLKTFEQDAFGVFAPTSELDIYDANKPFTVKPPAP